MPQVTLQRSADIVFRWPRPNGTEGEVTIPPVTVGQYRRALALEAEVPAHETSDAVQARLLQQARIMIPDRLHATFLDELDPEMVIEVIQCLLSVYSGLNPEAVVAVQRELKKKTLMEMLLALQHSASASATS